MSEENKFKPCPFCGGKLIFERYNLPVGKTSRTKWTIHCSSFCFSKNGQTKKELIRIFNSRPVEYAQAARIAELEEILVEILDNAVVNGVYREKAEKILKKAREQK